MTTAYLAKNNIFEVTDSIEFQVIKDLHVC